MRKVTGNENTFSDVSYTKFFCISDNNTRGNNIYKCKYSKGSFNKYILSVLVCNII